LIRKLKFFYSTVQSQTRSSISQFSYKNLGLVLKKLSLPSKHCHIGRMLGNFRSMLAPSYCG